MRISVDPNDSGYVNFVSPGFEVYLNGRPLKNFVTADEEQGAVWVFDLSCPPVGEPKLIRYQGRVKISRIVDWPAPRLASLASRTS